MVRVFWVALFAVVITACGQDTLAPVCITEGGGFDIEEVSTLEDNWGWSGLQDAIMLNYTGPVAPEHPGGELAWGVKDVYVLVMIADSEFNTYPTTHELEVQVFDSADLRGVEPFRVRQALDPSQLTWSIHTFAGEPTGATSDFPFFKDLVYHWAWWKFDFSTVIPPTGMSSTTYGVAVSWVSGDRPLVAYSDFNRTCAENWTNYDDAVPGHSLSGTGWEPNDIRFDTNICNWPMLKVSIERRESCY